MRVCVVAEYYPRRRDPVLGVWAHRQALAARDAGADVRVLVLERPLPSTAALRSAARGNPDPLVKALAGIARQPRHDAIDGIEAEYVRFIAPPRTHGYPHWDRWAAPGLRRALERLHESWPIDLVHAHYALPAGGAARPFAASHRLPLVISVHGGDVLGPALASPAARARVGELLSQSTAVLCNSAATLERAAALAGSRNRMRVVHLGADPPVRPATRRPAPTLVTLGHLTARKRHSDVLRSLHATSARLPELRWLVIGDGPEMPPLKALAAELGVAERVEWAGQLPPDRALEQLAGCHLMVMPSIDEAFGVAYVEALACGLPAIGCSGEGGPEEIAAVGEGMLLVPSRDVSALAETIERVLGSRARADELGDRARRTAVEHFSWERCGRATIAAYEYAIGIRE